MNLGAGAYKVGGARQCLGTRKEVSMATLRVAPTQTSTSFGAYIRGASEQDEMGPPTPTLLMNI